MRSCLIVILLIAGACKKAEPDAAVAKYANTDMAVAIARAQEGYALLDDLKVTDYGKPGLVKALAHSGTALRLANEAATKINAPPLMSTPHSDFLLATKELKGAVDTMIVAAGLGNDSKFAAGHAKLMEVAPYWYGFQERFNRQLNEAHVTFVPASNVPPLADDPPPPPPATP